jgi:lipid-binding SYLF domain-containing protein
VAILSNLSSHRAFAKFNNLLRFNAAGQFDSLPGSTRSMSLVTLPVDCRSNLVRGGPGRAALLSRVPAGWTKSMAIASHRNMCLYGILTFSLFSSPVFAKEDVPKRLNAAATVFSEVMSTPDKGIPSDLLQRAECIIIVPSLKSGGFIVGAKYGKGFILCRGRNDVGWSAPGAIRIEGGSFGLQIGAAETDVIMLVMNDQGRKAVLSSQYTIGGHAEVAAGPVGRSTSAQTSGWMTAGILSYSRAHGVFAGVSLEGSTLREDEDDNQELYGKKLTNEQIVGGRGVTRPASAQKLIAELNRYSPREKKS